MLETLQSFDESLFLLINKSWVNGAFDVFFPFITDLLKKPWAVMGALPLLLGFWVYKQRGYAIKGIVAALLVVSACDLFSYRVIKSIVKRPRPNHIEALASTVRVPGRPPSPSFPSNHATNMFGLAVVLSWYIPAGFWLFYLYAALVAYSRVYVGVHFPLDVTVGACLGVGVAFLLRKGLFERVKWFQFPRGPSVNLSPR